MHPLCSISHSMERVLTVPCTLPVCPAWGHLPAQPSPATTQALQPASTGPGQPSATACIKTRSLHHSQQKEGLCLLPLCTAAATATVMSPVKSHSWTRTIHFVRCLQRHPCPLTLQCCRLAGWLPACLQPGWAEDQLRPPRLP